MSTKLYNFLNANSPYSGGGGYMQMNTANDNPSILFPVIAEAFGEMHRDKLEINGYFFTPKDSAEEILNVIKKTIYGNDLSMYAEDKTEFSFLSVLEKMATNTPPPDDTPPRGGFAEISKYGIEQDILTGLLMPTPTPGTAAYYEADKMILRFEDWSNEEIEKRHSRLRRNFTQLEEMEERNIEMINDVTAIPQSEIVKNTNFDFWNNAPIETPGAKYWSMIQNSFYENIKNIDMSSYELNEDDSAKLFVDILEDYFRYNTTNTGFMIWTGSRWTPDLWKLAERAAALTAKVIQNKLSDMNPASLRDAANFVKHIRSAGGVRSILFFVSSDSRIVTSQEDYDNEHTAHLLNTPGGTYDIEKGILREHRRTDLLTKETTATPNPNHKPKIFNDFLNKITLGREDLKEALQRFLGSACSGKSPKDKIALFYGKGSNGKTVLLESCGDILKDYSASLDIKNLTEGQVQNSGHTDDLASLSGVRLCLSSESKKGIKLDEPKIKKLTGGDKIPVSRKHGRTFQMRGCFSLIILTNDKPRIGGTDHGIWRRVLLFPFDFKVKEEDKDLDFKIKMMEADAPYILHWLIEGCRKWYNEGYGYFETVESATKNYKSEEDVIGSFIDECCKTDKGFSVQAGKLRAAYDVWSKDNGDVLFNGRAWREALEEHGFTRSKGVLGYTWKGLTLLTAQSEELN